jgi:hypothetical protein
MCVIVNVVHFIKQFVEWKFGADSKDACTVQQRKLDYLSKRTFCKFKLNVSSFHIINIIVGEADRVSVFVHRLFYNFPGSWLEGSCVLSVSYIDLFNFIHLAAAKILVDKFYNFVFKPLNLKSLSKIVNWETR